MIETPEAMLLEWLMRDLRETLDAETLEKFGLADEYDRARLRYQRKTARKQRAATIAKAKRA